MFLVFGFGGFSALGAGVPQTPTQAETPLTGPVTLSLHQALEMASQLSPQYRFRLMAKRVANYGLQAAQRQRFPVLRLVGGYYDSPWQARQLIPATQLADVPPEERFDQRIGTLGLSLTLPLYEGGRIGYRTHAAADRLEAARHTAVNTLHKLQLRIARSFYQLLVLRQAERAVKLGLRYLTSAQSDTRRYVHAGTKPMLNLDRIEAALAQEQTALSQIVNQVLVQRAQLVRLVGLPSTEQTRVRVRGSLHYKNLTLQPLTIYLDHALQIRPDYLSLSAKLTARWQQIQIAAAEGRPQISLQAEYMRYKGFSHPQAGVQPGGAISLNFSWEFFASGQIQARTDQARAKYSQVQEQKVTLRKRIAYELRADLAGIQTSASAVRSSAAEVHASAQALHDEALRFKAGEATVTDLLDTEANAVDATVSHAQALAAYRLGGLALRVHIGKNLLTSPRDQGGQGGND